MLPQPWQNFAASFFTILVLGSPTFFMGKSQADKPSNSSANLIAKNRAPNGPEPKKSDPRQNAALAADRKAELETSKLKIKVGQILQVNESPRELAAKVSTKTSNNLKTICLAFSNYETTYNNFPAASIIDKKTNKPLLSWRVTILPYIEEEKLFKQFKLDEPWDSEHNIKLAKNMPLTYLNASSNKQYDDKTNYKIFHGNGAIFDLNKKNPSMSSISNEDGTSNTLLVVESEEPVLWTKPEDIEFNPNKPLPKMLIRNKNFTNGFYGAFADGSVKFIKFPLDPEIFKNLIQKNDGQIIPNFIFD